MYNLITIQTYKHNKEQDKSTKLKQQDENNNYKDIAEDYYECLACIKSKQTRMIKKLKTQKVSRD